MKPISKSKTETAWLLAFGAHPDDIEFGCGGVIAAETIGGGSARLVLCSRGEASSNGTPAERTREAQRAAEILEASLEFLELDGDARLERKVAHAIRLAEVIRRVRPAVVLAPSVVENQHPDHARLGRLVRDAARLARYGGIRELQSRPPHAIEQLLFYAVTPEAEPPDLPRIWIDVSGEQSVLAWKSAMEAHASQMQTRRYVEMQMTRARLNGLRAGVEYAVALFPADPLIFDSLKSLGRGARRF